MKRIFLLAMILLLPAGTLRASTNAVFTSVTGKVEIKGHKGHPSRRAHPDSTVSEGERVVAGPDAQATLKTFDGSEIQVSPNTDFSLEKLEQPGPQDKIIQFKLVVGKLFASVKKLVSSKSSFEIEAGGVVCGVRGTEYSVFYDPSTGKVDVLVTEGTVWSTAQGLTHEFHGGQGGTFLNGNWTPHQPPAGGNPGLGFIRSNPFYGFNGTGQDDFNNPLTDLPGGIKGVTGQIGSNGVAGLGAHSLLNLQLGFPQYLP
ncbi:MAG TPA: FecR family protein [bacterium]|jgi:hypothetical protein|nr:FecR family protein [bacterium]